MKKKSHMSWSWMIMVMFLVLGIYDFRFGILGFVCMGAPIYHALRGRGKVHCAKYCPRGSILGKFLQKVSLNNNVPNGIKTKKFKNGLLMLMLIVFGLSLYHAGWNFNKIAFSVFRFMVMSLTVGVIMGAIFKPRSWCMVCPMGHATHLIHQSQRKKVVNNRETKKSEKEKKVA